MGTAWRMKTELIDIHVAVKMALCVGVSGEVWFGIGTQSSAGEECWRLASCHSNAAMSDRWRRRRRVTQHHQRQLQEDSTAENRVYICL